MPPLAMCQPVRPLTRPRLVDPLLRPRVVIPAVSHFVLGYSSHRRPFDVIVLVSPSTASALSFLCLSSFLLCYSLRHFLFLDKLAAKSERVREGHTTQLALSFRLLCMFVGPCFVAEAAYKGWWYMAGGRLIPFVGGAAASEVVACTVELASWVYRTGTFFMVCVVFRVACRLEVLRLQDFMAVFGGEAADVESVLRQHLRIRRQLRVISLRFRAFIVCCLVIATANQFTAILLTTRSHAELNLFNAEVNQFAAILLTTRSHAEVNLVDLSLSLEFKVYN